MSQALLAPASDPLIGKTLAERYQVIRKLGEGGMGAVYEGQHLVIKKRVAIKLLHPQYATSPEVVARFHQEALSATAIGHEHIVEVNDMGRTPDGALFMVLEFLPGRDFADLLEKDSPLSIGRVAHIMAQTCDAVQAAHDKGIVHRDLKPENIYLIKRGGDPDFVKVLDFGISKMKDETGGSRSNTQTGAIMGTAYYLSPEQAMGKKSVDHRSDIWAIGVILFRSLTGKFPFDDEAYPMLIVKICTDTPPRPSAYRSDLPPDLDALIMRCLDKDPDKRPRSCSEIGVALAPFRKMLTVLPGTRLSAPSPAPSGSLPTTSELRPKRNESPDAFAHTMATPDEARPVSPATAAAAGLPSSSPSRVPLIAGLVVVGTLLAGGAAWFASQAGPTEVAVTEAPPTAPPIETPPPDPASDPTPPPTASLLFILSPSEAVALIDGRPVQPDATGDLHVPVDVEDTVVHELRVEARGFRSRIEDLRLSFPQRVVISLDPGSGEDDRRAAARSASAPAAGVARRHGSSATAAPGSAPVEAGATRVEPAHTDTPVVTEPANPAEPTAPVLDGVVVPPRPAGLRRMPPR
jgi:serine/threonine-protein kinase